MSDFFSNSLYLFIPHFQKYLGVPLVHFVLEFFLVVLILVIWRTSRLTPSEERIQLSQEEEDALIEDWQPDPIVPELETLPKSQPQITGKLGHHVIINNKICLNLATANFLDFVGDESIEKNAIKSILKYAVGTCGPRGFYGTTDVHIELEQQIANFCGTEEAIAYSYGFSTFSSAIASYCKRHDIIFADKGVCLPIQIGIKASRSRVFWFEHNNMSDLESKLKQVELLELETPKKFKNVRKFIIIEGIYLNYGDIVDLRRIVELKYRYKTRVFIDESLSMGILGETGRGVTQHLGIDINDIDLISFSFEYAFASAGGACIGSSYAIDHQRLSGLGYCFSASSPVYLCQAVIDEVLLLNEDSERIQNLQRVIEIFYNNLNSRLNKRLQLFGSINSPIFHIRFCENFVDYDAQTKLFDSIVLRCLNKSILILCPSNLEDKELMPLSPSMRISLNCSLTEAEIDNVIEVFCCSIDEEFVSLPIMC